MAIRHLSDAHVALGRAIRELREQRDMSQEALALRIGLDRTYVGGIERGERNVAFTNLLRIATGLGVRPSALLARAEHWDSEGFRIS